MKRLLFVLLLAASIFSCSKSKDAVPRPKTFLVSRATTVSSTGTSVNRFNRDVNGRLLNYIQYEGLASSVDSIPVTYDASGNISSIRFTRNGSKARWDYTYDAQGRLVMKQGYTTAGDKGGLYTLTYFDDRVEMLIAYDDNTNRYVYTYTPDKKNVATYKLYGTSGKLAEEETYTYGSAKAPRYGYEKLNGYENENAVEKTVRVTYNNALPNSPSTTVTFFRKITTNTDGYPVSMEYSASNSPEVSTTTYEYFVK